MRSFCGICALGANGVFLLATKWAVLWRGGCGLDLRRITLKILVGTLVAVGLSFVVHYAVLYRHSFTFATVKGELYGIQHRRVLC